MHPEIDLRVSATMHHVDFAREDVEMAVRHGTGNAGWSGLDALRLCQETLFSVLSAHLLIKLGRTPKTAGVLKLRLLHLDEQSGWMRWLAAAHVKSVAPLQCLAMNQASMVIDSQRLCAVIATKAAAGRPFGPGNDRSQEMPTPLHLRTFPVGPDP